MFRDFLLALISVQAVTVIVLSATSIFLCSQKAWSPTGDAVSALETPSPSAYKIFIFHRMTGTAVSFPLYRKHTHGISLRSFWPTTERTNASGKAIVSQPLRGSNLLKISLSKTIPPSNRLRVGSRGAPGSPLL